MVAFTVEHRSSQSKQYALSSECRQCAYLSVPPPSRSAWSHRDSPGTRPDLTQSPPAHPCIPLHVILLLATYCFVSEQDLPDSPLYGTVGAVTQTSAPYSSFSRCTNTDMCSVPKKPNRHPCPSAADDSRCTVTAPVLRNQVQLLSAYAGPKHSPLRSFNVNYADRDLQRRA